MKRYRISRFLKVFQKKDTVAIYHSTNMELFFTDKVTANKLMDHFRQPNTIDRRILEYCAQETISQLITSRLLISVDYDEVDELRKQIQKYQEERYIGAVYMILTDDCNLRCKYCFEDTHEAPDFRPSKMRKDTCYAAVELLAKLNKKYPIKQGRELTIEFYGGEPLLNFPALVFTTLYAECLVQEGRLPADTEFAMVTNGLPLTRGMAKFLAEHEVSVGISIDGPEEINDAYRGNGSFRKALHAYQILVEEGTKTGISCALTPLVVENFQEVLNFFEYELGLQRGLAFNIIHYNPKIPLDDVYYKKAARCILEAFPRFRTLRKWEDRMMRKAESFANQQITFADCAAIGHQLVISPDGQIGICQDFIKPRRYFNNSVFDKEFDPYEDEDFQEWRRRSPLNMPQCLDCEAIAICGGGCPASAQARYGNMWEVDRRICPFSKMALEWLIWDTYSQMQKS